MKNWCESCAQEIDRSDTVKAVEVASDQYIVPSQAELDALPMATAKQLVIEGFMPLADALDLTAFGMATHYALPESIAANRPFQLLRRTMRDRQRAAIGRMALRDREHAVVVLAGPQALVVTTVARPGDIRAVPDRLVAPEVAIPDRQYELAATLVDAMTGPFDPMMHRDDRGDALRALIQAKVDGSELITTPTVAPPVLVDLMAALEASVVAARRSRANDGVDGSAPLPIPVRARQRQRRASGAA